MKKKIAIFILFILFMVSGAGEAAVVSKTINSAPPAAGTWTDAISALYQNRSGFLNISVYGTTWAGTVFLQRRFQGGTWYDVTSFTTNTQKALVDREGGVSYRIGVKSGGYTSGSVTVRLSN